MNSGLRPRTCVVALLALLPAAAATAQQATHNLTFGVSFANRTSLRTSSSSLEVPPVDLASASSTVVGTIEYQAGARTSGSGAVVLTVEALREVSTITAGSPGSSSVALEFSGTDEGVMSGVLSGTPQVVGRWVGPGVRRGQLVFTLRGAGRISGGVIPLRFVLSAP